MPPCPISLPRRLPIRINAREAGYQRGVIGVAYDPQYGGVEFLDLLR
jgi:hypothetical protein